MLAVSALVYLLMVALAMPAVISCAYLLLQTLLSGEPAPPRASSRRIKFDLIVPAHNEASAIGATVTALRRIDWPADRYRIVVVADNCSDDTAKIAAEAGANVLERHEHALRGKGYALRFAFAHSRDEGWADAVAVVDADARVSDNLLEAFASRMEQGAAAAQVHYGVLNPGGAWRTRLLTVAMAAYHIVRSRARERLGVSSGIRGNGWSVTHELLQHVDYNAFSLAEDIEFGLDLGAAGYRVHYAGEAHASQEMTADARVARTQRQRWERGRFQLIRSRSWPLLLAAVRRRSAVCLDLALDLLVLPLTYIAINVAALLLASALLAWWQPACIGWLWLSIGCVISLMLYILRGWQLSETGARGLLDLAGAPVFIVWKVLLMLNRHQSGEWVRTERKSP